MLPFNIRPLTHFPNAAASEQSTSADVESASTGQQSTTAGCESPTTSEQSSSAGNQSTPSCSLATSEYATFTLALLFNIRALTYLPNTANSEQSTSADVESASPGQQSTTAGCESTTTSEQSTTAGCESTTTSEQSSSASNQSTTASEQSSSASEQSTPSCSLATSEYATLKIALLFQHHAPDLTSPYSHQRAVRLHRR